MEVGFYFMQEKYKDISSQCQSNYKIRKQSSSRSELYGHNQNLTIGKICFKFYFFNNDL